VAEFFHTKTRRELSLLLTSFSVGKPADTSFALVFVGGALPTAEVTAIKEAVKICDVVVAVWLPALARPAKGQAKVSAPGESYHAALQKLGVDIFALLPEEGTAAHVVLHDKRTNVTPETTTALLQGITTVLPNLVVIPRVHVQISATVRKLMSTFGDLAAIRTV